MGDTIRLGIIGTGHAATDLHLPALHRLERLFEVRAVCARSEQSARRYAARVGSPAIERDMRSLLSRDDVDAIVVAVPIDMTARVAAVAIRAGKHVMIEKPLASSVRSARRLAKLAERHRSVVLLAENFRYRPVYQRARSILDAGRIGRPFLLTASFLELLDAEAYGRTPWRIDERYPGGLLLDGGVHFMAALRVLLGEIASGLAKVQHVGAGHGSVDSMRFMFTSSGGVDGLMLLSYSIVGHIEHRIAIFGTAGSMIIQSDSITIFDEAGSGQTEAVVDSAGYVEEFTDFYRAIKGETAPRSTAREGLLDLELVMGAIRSAESGRAFSRRSASLLRGSVRGVDAMTATGRR